MHKKLLLLIMIIFFFIGWSKNPRKNTPVCTADRQQAFSRLIADGSGGTITVWQDSRKDSAGIYAQRLDAGGKPLWQYNGIPVCTANGYQKYPRLVSDGAGGAIIAWRDERIYPYEDIYLQRLNPSGKKLWQDSGVRIINSDGSRKYPELVSDGKGGAIITWSGEGGHKYAQRFSPAGKPLWHAAGVRVLPAKYGFGSPKIAADGFGGAFIACCFYNYDSFFDLAVYIQRVDSSGLLLWGNDGINIIKNNGGIPFDSYKICQLVPDGSGGVYITYYNWDDDCYYMFDPFTQRVNSQGTLCWKKPGTAVISGDMSYAPGMVSDGSGGAVVVWDNKGLVYAQRVDKSGKLLWQKNGVDVTSGKYYVGFWDAIPDGSGGVIIALHNYGTAPVYGQRLNSSGEIQWIADGAAVSTTGFYKREIHLANDGFGGGVFAWSAGQGTYHPDRDTTNIYAQNICANGKPGACRQPAAVIAADRFCGIAPAAIHFNGSGSFVAGGTIVDWEWDFGDGSKAGEEAVSHTYQIPGHYTVSLRVKGDDSNWSDKAEEKVRIFSPGSLDAKIEFDSQRVKANGKDLVLITAACYEKTAGSNKKPSLFSDIPADAHRSPVALPGNTVTTDLGLTFKTTSGTLQDEVIFDPSTGYYFQVLRSGAAGTAKVSAVVDGYELAGGEVEFTWPKPPVDLKVELKENRSLFMGEYYAYLSWSENPDEVFNPEKYRVYRSTNGGAFELVGEVDASTFTYVDSSLPAGNSYRYAVSMVDAEGDESPYVTGAN